MNVWYKLTDVTDTVPFFIKFHYILRLSYFCSLIFTNVKNRINALPKINITILNYLSSFLDKEPMKIQQYIFNSNRVKTASDSAKRTIYLANVRNKSCILTIYFNTHFIFLLINKSLSAWVVKTIIVDTGLDSFYMYT